MSQGKIIAVEGGPRSGKTFLVKRLAEKLGGHYYIEDDLQFPERLIEDMEQNVRPFERIIWFRNYVVRQYLDALKRKEAGEVVVMDGYWMTNALHIEPLFTDVGDEFEKKLCFEVSDVDRTLLPWPDAVIYLELSEEKRKQFVAEGGRDFDSSDEYFNQQILPVAESIRAFYHSAEGQKNLTIIDREALDFANEEDLQKVITLAQLD